MNKELIFVEKEMMDDIYNILIFNSFEVLLQIYFNNKSLENRQRILIDSAFGC